MVLFLFVIHSAPVLAQNINPGEDAIFNYNDLAEIHLSLTSADKDFLLNPANASSTTFVAAYFRMKNASMDTTLAQSVGIRLRGNTSRQHEKQSYRIDFREFGGDKFFGYKKFNLKSDVNDPSLLREILTYACYRNMDVPAPRVHTLKFFMNNEYMGVYLNVEVIDDEFIDKRYQHEDGFLYKCAYGANLRDNGQVFDNGIFESQMNEGTDTRTELDHFVDVLNNTSTTNFVTEIEKVFSVDRFLRQLAVEALLGHWDGYSYNKNNFYLFYDAQTKLIEFIPYDTDNTWGIDWVNRDWGTRDLNQWYTGGDPRPLTTKILAIPDYKWRYTLYLKDLLENFFNESYVLPKWNSHKALIGQAVEEDTYFSRAFGFTHTDFLNAYSAGMNNHVKYGIEEYLQTRSAKAIEQIPALITSVEVKAAIDLTVFPNPSSHTIFNIQTLPHALYPPLIYTTTGIPVSVQITAHDEALEISLPASSPPGLYLIRYHDQVIKWVLK